MPLAAITHAFGTPPTVSEVTLDPPGCGEVRVRIEACAICHSDVAYGAGAWGGELPAVYGHEAAGVVLEAGPGAAGLDPGTRVAISLVRSCGTCARCREGHPTLCDARFGLDDASPIRLADGTRVHQGMRCGAFADEVVVHASQAVPIPASIPATAASVIGCAVLTGLGAVERVAGVAAGSTVAVIGAGGVGVNAVQGAALRGAARVVAVDPVPERRRAALSFGATDVVDPAGGGPVAAVRDLCGGSGADAVIVTAGSAAAVAVGVECARAGGTVVVVGMPPGAEPVALDAGALAHTGKRILGTKLGDARPASDVPAVCERYAAGHLKLDELVTETYRLEDIAAALEHAAASDGLRTVVIP